MTREQVIEARRAMRKESAKYHRHLTQVPQPEWPRWSDSIEKPIEVWRSKEHLVQVFAEKYGVIRLSICRAHLNDDGSWADGITWDTLQRLKHECGFGDKFAMEIYPPDKDVVNVANIRHLWITPITPGFMWRKGE